MVCGWWVELWGCWLVENWVWWGGAVSDLGLCGLC